MITNVMFKSLLLLLVQESHLKKGVSLNSFSRKMGLGILVNITLDLKDTRICIPKKKGCTLFRVV